MWVLVLLGAAWAGCPPTVDGLSLPAWANPGDTRLLGRHLVVVQKGLRLLGAYRDGALLVVGDRPACFPVALGMPLDGEPPRGPKLRQGDHRTPEGWYRTSDKPSSSFYAAIAVHYPNTRDAARGVRDGLIRDSEQKAIDAALSRDRKPPQTTALGGEILLHGGGATPDWTLGCVALEDSDLDSLRATLPDGMRTDLLLLPY